MSTLPAHSKQSRGFSLVELMVAMTVGLLLLTGLSLIFVNSSQANRELRNSAQQIENGRYASDILTQDLHLAGFYGRLYTLPDPVGAPFDPCNIAAANAADKTVLNNALAWPVQGFRAADLATRANISATTCDDKGLLTNANLQPGSDVLVIRRAGTTNLNPPAVPPSLVPPAATATLAEDLYIQSTGVLSRVDVGTGAVMTLGLNDKVGNPAPLHKYVVHVYFVAPCSIGRGALDVCDGSAGEDTIPTLKRLELVSEGGARKMKIVPLVEGIEYFKVEYGVDNLPGLPVSTVTRLIGDGNVDSYTATPADWTTVIAAKVYLLARNPEISVGHVDTKTYVLGSTGTAANYTATPTVYSGRANFKRHTYTTATRMVNVAGRREIP
jgi:type IV pilus assembly protein PilW